MIPRIGVGPLALEGIEALDVGNIVPGSNANTKNQKTRDEVSLLISGNSPQIGSFIIFSRSHSCVKLHVFAEV